MSTPNKRSKIDETAAAKNDDGNDPAAAAAATTTTTTVMEVDLSNEKQIPLKSMDGQSFTVPFSVAKMFEFFKEDMIGDDDDDDEEMQPFDVPKITGPVLQKVIDFCTHYQTEEMKTIPQPLKTLEMKDYVQDWYANYIDNVDIEMLMKLIEAANYIHIQPLLDLTCAKVAAIMRANVPDRTREIFGIENDFTEEEMKKIIAENEWIEEP